MVLKAELSVLKAETSVLKTGALVLKDKTRVLKAEPSVLKVETSVLKVETSVLKTGALVLKDEPSILKNNLIAYIEAHATAMKIPQAVVTALKGSQQTFQTAFIKYKDPNHGKLDTAKNDAKDAYILAVRDFVKGYLYNPAVSEADRRSMEVPSEHRAPPSPVQDPATVPEAEVELSLIRWLIIHYRDKGSRSKAKPQGIHSAEIRWGVSDTPLPDPNEILPNPSRLRHPF